MLTTFYPPYSFGGDGLGVQRLAAALVGRGHEVTVVHDVDAYLIQAGSEPGAVEGTDGVEVISLRSSFRFFSCLLTHQAGRPVVHRRQIESLLQSERFDVIWYNNVSLVGGPGLLSLGNALKVYEAHEHWLVCPTHVLWRHGRELCDARQCLRCSLHYRRPPQLWRHGRRFQRDLDQVDAFIAKSEFSRSKHLEFGFERPMEVIPYFLPDEPEGDRAEGDGASPHPRPYFLFVGRLEKIKGLEDVIPVFADFEKADLLVIGDGDYRGELEQLATGIERVVFLGRMDPGELSRYYRGAIALIVPSICFETFGIILIESFRKGTPVIARRLGPFVEIVERSKGGLLFSDPGELLAAMEQMLADRPLRDGMSGAARKAFLANWSEEPVLRQYFQLLHDTALGRGMDRVVEITEAELVT